MRGFILKDLYILRKRLWLYLVFCLVMMISADIIAVVIGRAMPQDAASVATAAAFFVAAPLFLMTYSLECDVLFTDERRKWNAYSAASEAGVNAAVGAKYMLCFIMSFVIYLICRLNDIILSLLFDRTVQLSMLYLVFVFVISAIMAFQLFFGIRYGARYGTTMRIALFVGFFIIGMLYFLFGDIGWFMGEGGVQDKMSYLLDHMDDAGVKEYLAKLTGGAAALLSLIPHCIVALYWISYRLACRAYTKGAENYEK